jgi:hypothetical protein
MEPKWMTRMLEDIRRRLNPTPVERNFDELAAIGGGDKLKTGFDQYLTQQEAAILGILIGKLAAAGMSPEQAGGDAYVMVKRVQDLKRKGVL